MAAQAAGGPPGDGTAQEPTPAQLAAAWKKGGGFDALRKQLLADFLNAPEKDKFLADLDVSLPALLASTPSIARQERKDRPNAVIRSMKQIETLRPQIKAAERRLREDDAIASRIDSELARSLCQIKGVPYVEPEETKEAAPAEAPHESGDPNATWAAEQKRFDPPGGIEVPHKNGEVTTDVQVQAEDSTMADDSVPQPTFGPLAAPQEAERRLPLAAAAANGGIPDEQRTASGSVDVSSAEAAGPPSGVEPEGANPALPHGDGDNDVEMESADLAGSSGPS